MSNGFDFSNFEAPNGAPSPSPSGDAETSRRASDPQAGATSGFFTDTSTMDFGSPAENAFGNGSELDASSGPMVIGTPPVVWLGVGILVAVVAGAGAWFFGPVPLTSIIGWVLAGPVAITLFAVFTLKDTKARASPTYASPTWVPWLYRIGMVIILAAILVSALEIGLWVGRL